MSVAACFCPDTGKSNLGTLSCPSLIKTIKKHIFMNTFDSTGVRNGILLSDLVDGVVTDDFLKGKINESDPTKRWYFTPDVYEEVTSGRTEASTKEYPSGRIEKILDGVPNIECSLVGMDSRVASRFSSIGCSASSAFDIDSSGALGGQLSSNNDAFYPREINKGSFDASPVGEVEGSDPSKIVIKFQYSQIIIEGKYSIMNASLTETNLLAVSGLLDGLTTVLASPAVSATTVSINVPYDFPVLGNPLYIQGLEVAVDWELKDGVTPVTISGVIEGVENGARLDFTFTSTPVTDLVLSYIGTPASSTDQGFDINSVTFTTPA